MLEMEHLETLDVSRESIETIAPFLTIVSVETDFLHVSNQRAKSFFR